MCVCVCAGNNDVKLDEKQKCKVNDTAPPPLHIIFYFNIPNIHQLSEHSSVSITFVVIVQTMPWAVKLKELKVCHHTFFFLVCLPAESWSVNIRWEFNSCWGFFSFLSKVSPTWTEQLYSLALTCFILKGFVDTYILCQYFICELKAALP